MASALLLRVWRSVGIEAVCLAIGWVLTTTIALQLPCGFGMRQTPINLPQAKRKMGIVCEDIRGQSTGGSGQYRQQRVFLTPHPLFLNANTRNWGGGGTHYEKTRDATLFLTRADLTVDHPSCIFRNTRNQGGGTTRTVPARDVSLRVLVLSVSVAHILTLETRGVPIPTELTNNARRSHRCVG